MRFPSAEQAAVLRSDARVRLVKAGPGSGKTRLVAGVLEEALRTWRSRHRGAAVLSFTNVAEAELLSALGGVPGPPHFVGTLDAFAFRYVVKPFFAAVVRRPATPVLIPAVVADGMSDHFRPKDNRFKVRVGDKQFAHVFHVHFASIGEDGVPRLEWRQPGRGRGKLLDAGAAAEVHARKREIWKSHRLLSHSDVEYLATRLIESTSVGEKRRDALVHRFPFLVVDELQDTGWFHARLVRRLAEHPHSRSVLVGDGDQAIFEFRGATPANLGQFDRISGVARFPVTTSQRCPSRVCEVATHLSESAMALTSARVLDGVAELVVYEDYEQLSLELQRLADAAPKQWRLRVLTRATTTVDALNRSSVRAIDGLGSRPLRAMWKATEFMRVGKNERALGSADHALAIAYLGSDVAADELLEAAGIARTDWEGAVLDTLAHVLLAADAATIGEWGEITKQAILAAGAYRRWVTARVKLPRKLLRGEANPFRAPDSDRQPAWRAQTVHSAKGETHDVTALVVPPTEQSGRCPSHVWWSDKPTHLESKRIAYVGLTRPRCVALLCVCPETFARLAEKRPDFVECFEVTRLGNGELVNTTAWPALESVRA